MSPELIPSVDPMPLPAPAWLFHVLLVFTFFLHALFMNLTLGGTILAAVGRLKAGRDVDDYRGVLADRLVYDSAAAADPGPAESREIGPSSTVLDEVRWRPGRGDFTGRYRLRIESLAVERPGRVDAELSVRT